MLKNKLHILLILLMISACKQNPVLKETVISMKEIKEIGELVTAEYYGEVIAGHSMILLKDNIEPKIRECIANTRTEINNYILNVETEFKKDSTACSQQINLIEYRGWFVGKKVKLKNLNKKIKKYEKQKTQDLKKLSKNIHSQTFETSLSILKKITKEKPEKIIRYIKTQKNDSIIYNTYKPMIDKFINKTNKKELVYIGRGSVKVGYDMHKLDSSNIFFSPEKDTMYIFDFDPEITDLDINPYFYYPSDDPGIDSTYLGFQIIYSNNQENFTLDEINTIKSNCKIKLRQEALKRKIYENAQRNGELALTNFLGIMKTTDNRGIKKVMIIHSKYFTLKNKYTYDLKIDSTELNFIDDLVHEDLDSLDPISFKYQTLEYQQQHLDQFMLDLHRLTINSDNTEQWDSLYENYALQRGLN